MTILEFLLQELDQEAKTTRKMLARVPEDKFDWQPHAKSMTLIRLATHVAELPSWIAMTLDEDELDFSINPYKPVEISSTDELLEYFEKTYIEGKANLEKADESQFSKDWTLREGDVIYQITTKLEMLRMTFSQIIHHRAQLGVYLRLLEVPIPGSYGPSADEAE